MRILQEEIIVETNCSYRFWNENQIGTFEALNRSIRISGNICESTHIVDEFTKGGDCLMNDLLHYSNAG